MKYLLLGAGIQGTAIAFDLLEHAHDTAELVVVDRSERALGHLRSRFNAQRLHTEQGDVSDPQFFTPLVDGCDCVISAVNYWHNVELAKTAIAGGSHFIDLGGNHDVVARELELDALARDKGVTIIPDCGLSPGLTCILGYHLFSQLSTCESLRLRAGGLPQHARPPLNYQHEFSVQGLINEYVEPAMVIQDGRAHTVPPLTQLETVVFPDPWGELEAFQTSGGTSTLPHTLEGRIDNLDYKTIRYPGHCEHLLLLYRLGFFSSELIEHEDQSFRPRKVLEAMLERSLPTEGDDVVLVLIEAEGTERASETEAPNPVRKCLRIIDKNDRRHAMSAMARMTGYPAAIIARMLASGEIAEPGAHPQELIVPAERLIAEMKRRDMRIETWTETPAAVGD